MKYGFAISDRALGEMFQAFEWYEEQSVGLGDRFMVELEKNFETIFNTPQSFKRSYKLFRQIPFKKFPYLIVYFIDDFKKIIVVTSVFHTS